jgi:hypothetical protein
MKRQAGCAPHSSPKLPHFTKAKPHNHRGCTAKPTWSGGLRTILITNVCGQASKQRRPLLSAAPCPTGPHQSRPAHTTPFTLIFTE